MAKKGREKNIDNKAKHSKLIAQKKSKAKTKYTDRKARLKEIVDLAKAKKAEES
ncbi:hypothetical protein [Winogradskyella sp. UBA3174]|uniref:hypothetical protein n=1 Tax=Winogradskyella sp. UBA3174 TaxID=1947785 RepID=UPI0025DCEB1A|nr:hypothetical protein [Winogradskyella sp. UBA3174]|tara:strand:+ start:3167 stop:3328 length:162 start_codon:yes stop_codon:yes gene_type:complete